MLMFPGVFKVVKVEDGLVKRGKIHCRKIEVEVGGMRMPAFVKKSVQCEEGVIYTSNEVAVSGYVENGEKYLALFIKSSEVAGEDVVVDPKTFVTSCNGKLVKTDKAVLRKVGTRQQEFLPCTLAIQTEDGKFFNAFLVCFNEQAIEVNNLPSGTYINAVARIKQRRMGDGFEMNLSSFEVVGSEKKDC